MNRLTKILAAVSFLTVIPVHDERAYTKEALLESAPYFPFAGAMVGLVASAVYTLTLVMYGPRFSGVVALFVMMLLTRGLHLYGYVRTAGTFSGEKTFGVFGVSALIFLLLLKTEVLILALTGFAVQYLVAVPLISRAAILPVMYYIPAVANDPLSSRVSIGLNAMRWSLGLSLIAIFIFSGPQGVGAFLLSLFVAYSIGRYSQLRLGGITGDVYGFIIESVEVVALSALAL